MNKWTLFCIVTCVIQCSGRDPFKPKQGALPFLVYFASRYRGICMGFLVSRTAVMTAAVCVVSPFVNVRDTRPINVVVGASYRHPRRGIRVQVNKILMPYFHDTEQSNRVYLLSKSTAVLLLRRKVPDALVEFPLRPIYVDYREEDKLTFQEECIIAGWHFFYKGEKIHPLHKFLLQRHVRAQYVFISKKSLWCEALSIKFQKALSNLGFLGYYDRTACICVRDPDSRAQACHCDHNDHSINESDAQGMYGAPLICKGKAVGMLMAPDAQWMNCTGHSNLIHVFHGEFLKAFLSCVSSLFDIEEVIDWDSIKQNLEERSSEEYDPLPEIYDKLTPEASEENPREINDDFP